MLAMEYEDARFWLWIGNHADYHLSGAVNTNWIANVSSIARWNPWSGRNLHSEAVNQEPL